MLLVIISWVVYCGMQTKSVRMYMHDEIKVGLLNNNAGYM